MYNLIKKFIAVFGVGFLVLGGFSFGVQPLEDDIVSDSETNSSKSSSNNPDEKLCTSNWKRVVESLICKCDPWYKRVDDKWCLSCDTEWVCCWVELNTNVPFIGNCIELSKNSSDTQSSNDETKVTEKTAFPVLMWWLTKILVTVIMLVSFVAILAWWVMIASSGWSDSWASNGKKLIWRVVIALALLGASGVILRLINPNFFW